MKIIVIKRLNQILEANRPLRYLIGFGLLLGSISLVLQVPHETQGPLLIVILINTILGGVRLGIISTALAAIALAMVIFPSKYSTNSLGDVVIFSLEALLIILVVNQKNKAEQQLRKSERQLKLANDKITNLLLDATDYRGPKRKP